MKVTHIPDELRLIPDNATKGAISSMWNKLIQVVNYKISYSDPQSQAKGITGNIDGVWPGTLAAGYTVTTPGSANTEFTVTHNLGRVPVGYDIKSKDRAGQIYDSRKASWTNTQMFLKADTASMSIVLFVH